ncbi:hypothetical protein NCCNTM_30880 [Mycolicibacterium sp. NCC-Tsukiji]|nr:hypothetical protein NCCNTM_30880 [Mycolicibacterium sp. NCC-Tsukiji]
MHSGHLHHQATIVWQPTKAELLVVRHEAFALRVDDQELEGCLGVNSGCDVKDLLYYLLSDSIPLEVGAHTHLGEQ